MRIHFKILILVVHCFLPTWLIFRQMFSRIIKVKFRGFIFVTHINSHLVSYHLCGYNFGCPTKRKESAFYYFCLPEVCNHLYSSVVGLYSHCAPEHFGELLKTPDA